MFGAAVVGAVVRLNQSINQSFNQSSVTGQFITGSPSFLAHLAHLMEFSPEEPRGNRRAVTVRGRGHWRRQRRCR